MASRRASNEVDPSSEDPAVWNDQKRAQELGKEKKSLESVVVTLNQLDAATCTTRASCSRWRARRDDDATLRSDRARRRRSSRKSSTDLEFRRMFTNPIDPNNCFIDIQAGAGGTEAQDWASMLLRMYLRYCERKGFNVEVLEESPGEVAGIKSATIKVDGDYAYGHLRTETGVHRLVRKSPFDSGNRPPHVVRQRVRLSRSRRLDRDRHQPGRPAHRHLPRLRRRRPAHQQDRLGGAHHALPTGIVVQCQNDRSQHRNRAEAMAMLKSRLYELELRKRNEEQQKLEDAKTDIGWGHQIRSYVLDQSRIKDLRTNVEIGNTQAVLDGDLDDFIAASLKQGI